MPTPNEPAPEPLRSAEGSSRQPMGGSPPLTTMHISHPCCCANDACLACATAMNAHGGAMQACGAMRDAPRARAAPAAAPAGGDVCVPGSEAASSTAEQLSCMSPPHAPQRCDEPEVQSGGGSTVPDVRYEAAPAAALRPNGAQQHELQRRINALLQAQADCVRWARQLHMAAARERLLLRLAVNARRQRLLAWQMANLRAWEQRLELQGELY